MQGSAGRRDPSVRNKTVGRILVSGGVITAEQLEWLIRDGELANERIEDAIVYRGLVSETDLLKYLASHHKTRFVSTEKLSKAEFDRATLAMIPRQVAETFGVFPVTFDAARSSLGVVTADPDEVSVLAEIQKSAMARELKPFVARPAAIRAAIAKGYGGDAHAFALLNTVMTSGAQTSSRVVKMNQLGAQAPVQPVAPGPVMRGQSMQSDFVLELDDGPIGGRPGQPQQARVPQTAAQQAARAGLPQQYPAQQQVQRPPPLSAQQQQALQQRALQQQALQQQALQQQTLQQQAQQQLQQQLELQRQQQQALQQQLEQQKRELAELRQQSQPGVPFPSPPPGEAQPGSADPMKQTLVSAPSAAALANAKQPAAAAPAPAAHPAPVPPRKQQLVAAAAVPIAPQTPRAMPAAFATPSQPFPPAPSAPQIPSGDPPTAPPPPEAEALRSNEDITRRVASPRTDRDPRRVTGPGSFLDTPTRPHMQAVTEQVPISTRSGRMTSSIPPVSARATVAPAAPPNRSQTEAVTELVNVFVSLLESGREELEGHSSLVARLMRRFGERLGLPNTAIANIALAAQLHDVGKSNATHLTALNVAGYDSFRLAAQKTLMTPTRLLAAARIPAEALEPVEQMYERYDGKGIPNGFVGQEIILGGRMLAIADTYADLVENSANAFRRQLSPQEACAALEKEKGSIFDAQLVDVFRSLINEEEMKAKILSNRRRALLVDPDADETTVLELRLIEQGFEVKTARSSEQALRMLTNIEFDLVVSELDIGKTDGLALLQVARTRPWGQDLPWVVYTRRQSADDAQRAFELDVLDFVGKPAQPDVLIAKLRVFLDQRRARKEKVSGVSGSLLDFALPDLVQILAQGRKTGALRLTCGADLGEVHFDQGSIVQAVWNATRGPEAFYAMLKLKDGEFDLDPTFKPNEHVIQMSAEGLLLEGLRRLDEGL